MKKASSGPPLPVLPCACASLRRAARAASQVYDRELRAAGMTVAQFTLLQALSLIGETTQSGLGHVLALDSTTLTRTLQPLERRGWIRRQVGKDRREKKIVLTGAGRTQFRRALPSWTRAQEILRVRVGRGRWKELLGELARLAEDSAAD